MARLRRVDQSDLRIRPFPFLLRPYALETPESFFARLKKANYCEYVGLAHRARVAATAYPEHRRRARNLAAELLGGLPIGTFDLPRYRGPAACDVAGCECALTVGGGRLLCIQCAKGERVELVPTLEPFVCIKHGRWTGPDAGFVGQLQLRGFPSYTRAAAQHRTLLREGRFDPQRFRTIWKLLDRAYADGQFEPGEAEISADWRYDPARHAHVVTYPAAVALYALLENPTILGRLLHPHNDLAAVESFIGSVLLRAAGVTVNDALVRSVRYHLRPDYYRVARSTTQGWHESSVAKYPPPKTFPHDRDLGGIDFSTWPSSRDGVPPGFPGFDTTESPLHIYAERGSRFRHEFWYEPRARLFDELRGGHGQPCWWICRAGHVTEALLSTRNRSGREGCGTCSGKISVPGVTDIATTHPEAFTFWDHAANVDLPYWEQTAGRDRVAAWKCPRGDTFRLPIDLFLADPRCKRCDVPNRRIVDLSREFTQFRPWWDEERNIGHHPESLAMWSEVVSWICPGEGHRFPATLRDLQRRGGRCPVCSHRRLIPGVNDLQTLYPDKAEEFSLALNDGLTPDRVWPASPKQYLWVCRKRGHIYKLSPRERTALDIGCTKCTGRRSEPGESDFGTVKPEAASRWHTIANGTLTPQDVHPGSARLAYFTCLCDRAYQCEIRMMRIDRYCRDCTDELRRWHRER